MSETNKKIVDINKGAKKVIITKSKTPAKPKVKRIMIATPTHDGTLTVHYNDSMLNTILMGSEKGILVRPVYFPFEALIQRARNELFQIAYNDKVDAIFFIDADMQWNPEDFFKIFESNKNIIGAPCVKKSMNESYNVKIKEGDKNLFINNGLIEVASVGTGFMCVKKAAIKKLYENAESYIEKIGEEEIEKKSVFEVVVRDKQFFSEDVEFCNKARAIGESIYINPYVNIAHIGNHAYYGNFINWCNKYDVIRNKAD